MLGKAVTTDRAGERTEIEQAVNKRQLTQVGALGEGQPLTPAALIGMDVWPGDVENPDEADVNQSAQQLTQRMRYVRTIAEHLRQRWRPAYLVMLNCHHPSKSRPITEGDIVFIVDTAILACIHVNGPGRPIDQATAPAPVQIERRTRTRTVHAPQRLNLLQLCLAFFDILT